jgi:hypothetical protein
MGATGRRYKLVLTVHDMVFYHHQDPTGYSWYMCEPSGGLLPELLAAALDAESGGRGGHRLV